MYTTIDSCVRAALAEKGYSTLHKYILYLHFALEGLYKCKRDGAESVSIKKTKIKPNNRNAVPWPKDMIWYKKIGVTVTNRILTFVPDSSISLFPEDHAHDNDNPSLAGFPLQAESDLNFDFLQWTNLYFSNGTPFLRGGAGSYLTKHFRVNQAAREFQLDGQLSGLMIDLEYFSNNTNPNSQTVISHHVGLTLKEFCHYREARFKLGAGSLETKASEQDFLNELDESLAAQSDLTANSIMDALSQSTRWTILQ